MSLSLVIVVLHYSGLNDTLECLASLRGQSGETVHTVVVDNGSVDQPARRILAEHPWVEVIELQENLGWSGGNNAGIRLAMARQADFVCLLNNDTVLPPGAVARLMETAALLGPCILHPAIDSYDAGELSQLDPATQQPPDLQATPVPGRADLFAIDRVNGSCVLVHLDIFRSIGLIDERFFLLCEDADLGKRALSAGCRIFCDGAARIRHKESRSFGGRRTPIKTYYGIRNVFLLSEKHGAIRGGLPGVLRDFAWTMWGTAEAAGQRPRSWVHLFCWSLSRDVFARAGRMGMRDYLLRRFGRINARDGSALTGKSKARS